MAHRDETRDQFVAAAESSSKAGQRVGAHYEILGELGRGGMACVYRVLDVRSGEVLALKHLLPQSDGALARDSALLFEREFHTLAQLQHPRVIEVYDYGVDPDGAYYTMELLDGGDLRDRSPLDWREACELIFDVCSSLALLHSRHLVHRDVSPRNVRCTHAGHAKLIDFGAMAPIGIVAQVVGTPPFVAPEAVYTASLDARSDLFSLGATLYFALTGRLAYPARTFAQLRESWANKPAAPSAIVPAVPKVLDRLVMSLISLEPALRPRAAFEVMQRLASIAGITRDEPLSVSNAYLTTPMLVAREEVLASFRAAMDRARHGRGDALLIVAPTGLGRTRILDACVLEARTLGCAVLRASGSGAVGQELAAARTLAEQVLELAPALAFEAARAAEVEAQLFENAPAGERPVLRSFAGGAAERSAVANAIVKWLARVSRSTPLLIAVDDSESLDDASIALLATLAQRATRFNLLVLAAARQLEGLGIPSNLDALSNRCQPLSLRALSAVDTQQLLGSVFGDVPNLALLTSRIHEVAAGRPREIMSLAQYLVDRETIRYVGGSWSLPEELSAGELPASAVDVFRARVSQLNRLARRLAEAQALALGEQFTREDYAALEPDASAHELDVALADLLSHHALTNQDGRHFALERALVAVLDEAMDAPTRRDRYRALAEHHEQRGAEHAMAAARCWLLAGERQHGLDRLLEAMRAGGDPIHVVENVNLAVSDLGQTLRLALQAALDLGRPTRQTSELRRWLVSISVYATEDLYFDVAPAWRAQLEQDSGLTDYAALREVQDSNERLMQALTNAAARYARTPEHERVYAPEEAIRLLVHYVAMSIAQCSRSFDVRLALSLPELLEPFAPLSPLISAIWQNSIALIEASCYRQVERANERWLEVYEGLEHVTGQDAVLVRAIRYAIVYGVGVNEAALGMASAIARAELLDQEPAQRISAMYLRKVVRLQQGDLEGAERCRKQAELLALHSRGRELFNNLLILELSMHAAAWDLMGVKQITSRIEPLAERYANWMPVRHLAEGHYRRLLGELLAAERAYRRALALSAPTPDDPMRSIVTWPLAVMGLCETLVELDRADEARTIAADALRECERRKVHAPAYEVVRALGLAEGKIGHYAEAAARLDRLIAEQVAAGSSGLVLGMTYEARARVAVWARDQAAVAQFGELTAEQYRHGRGSSLGARYERLLEEARSAGVFVLPALSPFEDEILGTTQLETRVTASAVTSALSEARDPSECAQRALHLLCEVRGAPGGHLFVATSGGLQLAATSVTEPADDMLHRLLTDFWDQQMDDDEPETALVSGNSHATQIWTNRNGTVFRPLLLIGTPRHGEQQVAGVALIQGHAGRSATAEERRILNAIADALLRTAR